MAKGDSIFISAGDPSADFPGQCLIDEITAACPDMAVFGLGGPLMREAGLTQLVDHRKLAVMGFWEVVPRLFFFRRLLHTTFAAIEARRPRAVVLIDYPGFNLRLAERIKPLGIPIVYYITPQVWAWGKRRVHDIERLIDHTLVIFPFEVDFFRANGIEARFTGHPIVDRYAGVPDAAACRQALDVPPEERLVALLPGSRPGEVRRMLPTMIGALKAMRRQAPDLRFIVAGVEDIEPDVYSRAVGGEASIITGRTPEILQAADVVITSSGTATVETAFFATPMIVIYKTGWLTYQIARRLVTLDAIGMVNIVAGKKIVPELIQGEAEPNHIADEAMALLGDPERYRKTVAELTRVRGLLGDGGAGKNAFRALNEAVGLC